MRNKLKVILSAALVVAVSSQAQTSFFDDFERSDVGPGWNERVGFWEIDQNTLRIDQWDPVAESLITYDDASIDRAFVIEADLMWVDDDGSGANRWNGLIWNVQDADTYYIFRMRADNGNLQILKREDGGFTEHFLNASGAVGAEADVFHRFRITGDGRGNFSWSVSRDEETLASGSFSDDDPFPAGPAGFYSGLESLVADNFRIETFDFDVEMPDVNIFTAVEVDFNTSAGVFYQVESSADLEEWTPEEGPIEGDGQNVTLFFSTRDDERRFFRVLVSEE